MKHTFKVSGKKFALPQKPNPKWKLETRPGNWILVIDSETGQRQRFQYSAKGQRATVLSQGRLFHGEIQNEGSTSSQKKGGGSDADLTAQFPGKIRKILVAVDTLVKEGDPLLLVEAMKMEFSIKAPFSGKIKAILVKEGAQMSPGDRFVEIIAE